jgi:hypothetical protein
MKQREMKSKMERILLLLLSTIMRSEIQTFLQMINESKSRSERIRFKYVTSDCKMIDVAATFSPLLCSSVVNEAIESLDCSSFCFFDG